MNALPVCGRCSRTLAGEEPLRLSFMQQKRPTLRGSSGADYVLNVLVPELELVYRFALRDIFNSIRRFASRSGG